MATTLDRESGMRGDDRSNALALAQDREGLAERIGMERIEEHADWDMLSQIPMLLSAGVQLPKFRVRDLMALKTGQMVESVSPICDDVPLKIGAVQLGWIEFEVVAQRMAVRLTRLA